eukprot:TRINITY_DN5079_c0_g1_i1.p1 TRINITY_DN5079_c0_g1~~TRINITY_DN5079_c0_g1_i1.p1  ORF type:complete len:149 (+),score=7.93 TRINITY_DN5079_c0_g1_i1:780-1226(+)
MVDFIALLLRFSIKFTEPVAASRVLAGLLSSCSPSGISVADVLLDKRTKSDAASAEVRQSIHDLYVLLLEFGDQVQDPSVASAVRDVVRDRRWSRLKCAAVGCVKVTGLKRCAGCERVSYCGKTCQTSHWKAEHKRVCKTLKERFAVQ